MRSCLRCTNLNNNARLSTLFFLKTGSFDYIWKMKFASKLKIWTHNEACHFRFMHILTQPQGCFCLSLLQGFCFYLSFSPFCFQVFCSCFFLQLLHDVLMYQDIVFSTCLITGCCYHFAGGSCLLSICSKQDVAGNIKWEKRKYWGHGTYLYCLIYCI